MTPGNSPIKTILALLLLLLLLLLSILPRRLHGGNRDTFTLQQAQTYALRHAYSIKDANLDIRTAQKNIWQSITKGLPQIKNHFTYNHNLEVPSNIVDFDGHKQVIKMGTPYNATYSLTIDQILLDGSYIVGLKAAKVYMQAAQNNKEKTAIDIKEAVANAYYLVLAAEENNRMMAENLDNSRKNLKEVTAYFKNGFRESQEVQQVQLLVKQAEIAHTDAIRQVEITRAVLKFAMGMKVASKIILADTLEHHLARNGTANSQETLAPAFNVASHIDSRSARTMARFQRLQYRSKKIDTYLPKLSLAFSYSYNAMTDSAWVFGKDINWTRSAALGLKITVPVFDFGGKQAEVAKARIQYRKALNREEMVRENLNKEYMVAMARLKTSIQNFDNAKESRLLAKEIYNKTAIKFKNGLAASSELNLNQNQYLQAHGRYLERMITLLKNRLTIKKLHNEL